MADEQPRQDNNDGNKQKTGKRRYFRRRRSKNKKSDPRPAQPTTSENASPKSGQRKGAPPQDRQSSSGSSSSSGNTANKKRRSRRRRSTRRSGQQPEVTQVIQEQETPYEEPTSVYVYTHVVRPDYRDSMSDYRPETSYLAGESHKESAVPAITLSRDILEQLEHYFTVQEQGGEPPRRIEYNEADWADDDDWNESEDESSE